METAMDAWAPRLAAAAGMLPSPAHARWAASLSPGIGPWRLRRRFPAVFVVAAAGKKRGHDGASSSGNGDSSAPRGDGSKGDDDSATENSKSKDSAHRIQHSLSDWRDFRANLVAREQEDEPDALIKGTHLHDPAHRLGLKWAHPIAVPETGCVLVATEKLDGVSHFERAVVLLLRLGSRDIREGPFGVILNRPLNKKIKQMKAANSDVANIFADCSLYFGGPLDASMFLLRTSDGGPKLELEKVVPGICFGARNDLDSVGSLVKKGALRPQDFKFFVGYAGWQFDQLLDEVEEGYWVVAACSSQLIIDAATADSSAGLWEEILQLMGGQYSELSRKPRQDGA